MANHVSNRSLVYIPAIHWSKKPGKSGNTFLISFCNEQVTSVKILEEESGDKNEEIVTTTFNYHDYQVVCRRQT